MMQRFLHAVLLGLLAQWGIGVASASQTSSALQVPHKAGSGSSTIQVLRFCERVGSKLGSVDKHDCLRSGLRATGGQTVEGEIIAVREYPPIRGARRPLGRVLVLGGIHGDEYSSVSIVFKWMEILSQYHSGLFHWHVVPVTNPDGLLRRKSQRMNANGVDLNRNFPTANWTAESRKYWERTGHAPRRYPGHAPGSEPETQWLVNEIEQFRPDVIVQIHAPYGLVDFDGPSVPPTRLGKLHLSLMGTFPGSLGNYGGSVQGIPVVTIELPSAGALPDDGEISRIWTDLVRWLRRRLPDDGNHRFASGLTEHQEH